jgi:hypothetical protein
LFFDDTSHSSGALVFGGDLLVPGLGTRIEVGAGLSFDDDLKRPRFALDAGFVGSVGLSWHGALSHEVDLGALFLIADDLDVMLHVGYRPTIEAGEWLMRFGIGPAFDVDTSKFGLYTGIGIAKLVHVAGGGVFTGARSF